MVRRLRRGLDDLPRVLPVSAALRLRVLRLDHASPERAPSGRAPHRAARPEPRFAAHSGRSRLEAERRGGTGVAHPRTPERDDRSALLSAVHHRAAGAGVVCTLVSSGNGVPPLCAIELRITSRAHLLSVPPRTLGKHALSIARLERGLRALRGALRRRGALQHALSNDIRAGRADHRRDERRAAPDGSAISGCGCSFRPWAPSCCSP